MKKGTFIPEKGQIFPCCKKWGGGTCPQFRGLWKIIQGISIKRKSQLTRRSIKVNTAFHYFARPQVTYEIFELENIAVITCPYKYWGELRTYVASYESGIVWTECIWYFVSNCSVNPVQYESSMVWTECKWYFVSDCSRNPVQYESGKVWRVHMIFPIGLLSESGTIRIWYRVNRAIVMRENVGRQKVIFISRNVFFVNPIFFIHQC